MRIVRRERFPTTAAPFRFLNAPIGGIEIRPRYQIGWAILFAASLTALRIYFLPLGRVLRGQNDFLSLYAGAKLSGTPYLYSLPAAKDVQQSAANIWLPTVIYSRPPLYAALLKPIGALPYRTAYAIFEALNLAALCVFLWCWARRDRLLLILGAISIPVATAFANGQDVLLLVLLCAAAWELDRRGKSFWCGAILPLLSIKFHFFLFIPAVLIVQKRWRMLSGAALTGGVLFLVAAVAQGWNWPAEYAHFLRTAEITPTGFTMPNMRGLLIATVGDRPRLEWILAAALAVIVIYAVARIRDFGPALALAIAAGLLTSHHAYVQDASLLLLIPVMAPNLRRSRKIALALIAPPIYFLLMADGPVSGAMPAGLLVLFAVIAAEAVRKDASVPRQTTAECTRMYS